MEACDFSCDDVKIIKHFQNMKYDKDSICMMLISEAVPINVSEYFDAKGNPQFIINTNVIFNDLGYNYKTYKDYLRNGIYLTTALKCAKKGYLVKAKTIENCSYALEKEYDQLKNVKVVLLMGDFAIKAMNYIWKRKHNEKAIPSGSTYKIRKGIYESYGIRFFPSYTQTGESFGIEKSKVKMIMEDVQNGLEIIES
jgi:hypothetical protein